MSGISSKAAGSLPNKNKFTGNEEQKNEFSDESGLDMYDFKARMYNAQIGRFQSTDPEAQLYFELSTYAYVRNNPILRIDPTGKWDVTVHVYNRREKYGYGIAIVTDRNGNEVFRFKVRAEGVGGRNRMVKNSDTPLGVYDIPKKDMWISGKSRKSYGPNSRLVLYGESGEISESGRSEIRIHGGRQETYDKKTGTWVEISNPTLKKTHGCMRAYDEDIAQMKIITDELQKNDENENGGKLTIVDDLVEEGETYSVPESRNDKPGFFSLKPPKDSFENYEEKMKILEDRIKKIKNLLDPKNFIWQNN